MKKAIVLFLILVLTVSMLCFSAAAEEAEEHNFAYDSYDSRLVPEAIQETPEYQENKISLRIYGWASAYFDTHNSIEDVLPNCLSYYLVKSSTNWIKYEIENGCARITGSWGNGELFTKHEAINAVSPDIRIENMYYFYTSYPYHESDLAIYYRTNMGDYVYFSSSSYDPMLMGAEQYFEFTRRWTEYQNEMYKVHGILYGGRYTLPGDWSVYNWNSPHFDPDAPLLRESEFPWLTVGVGAAVLAAAAVTTVLIIRKKRKKAETEEMELTPEET